MMIQLVKCLYCGERNVVNLVLNVMNQLILILLVISVARYVQFRIAKFVIIGDMHDIT